MNSFIINKSFIGNISGFIFETNHFDDELVWQAKWAFYGPSSYENHHRQLI